MIYNHDPVIADLHRHEAEQDRAIAREERLDARAQELARQVCEHEPEEVVGEAYDDEGSNSILDGLLVELARTAAEQGAHPERTAIADRLAAELWKAALRAARREAEREEEDDR